MSTAHCRTYMTQKAIAEMVNKEQEGHGDTPGDPWGENFIYRRDPQRLKFRRL